VNFSPPLTHLSGGILPPPKERFHKPINRDKSKECFEVVATFTKIKEKEISEV